MKYPSPKKGRCFLIKAAKLNKEVDLKNGFS